MKKPRVSVLMLAVVAVIATVGLINAGDLDQTEAPAPTMKNAG